MFFRESTILDVKEKLYRHGGTGVSCAELYLRRGYDTIFMYDQYKTLRDYRAENDMEIHIKDTDIQSLSRNGGLEDVSQVEKYQMTDADYDRRENTVRKQKAAAWQTSVKPSERPETPNNVEELYPLDARCEVNPGGRRGTVVYVGTIDGLSGKETMKEKARLEWYTSSAARITVFSQEVKMSRLETFQKKIRSLFLTKKMRCETEMRFFNWCPRRIEFLWGEFWVTNETGRPGIIFIPRNF